MVLPAAPADLAVFAALAVLAAEHAAGPQRLAGRSRPAHGTALLTAALRVAASPAARAGRPRAARGASSLTEPAAGA